MTLVRRRRTNVPVRGRSGSEPGVVLRPVSAMRSAQVVACSFSLVAAGVLLARGFSGLAPSRPVFIVLGAGLAVSAVLGLVIDHVEVRSHRQRPDHVLVDEINRSRRFGHPLALLSVTVDDAAHRRMVALLRSTDLAWRSAGKLQILLVETDRAGAVGWIERVGALVPSASFRLAVFPDDAVTIDGLRNALRRVDHDGADAEAPVLRIASAPVGAREAGGRHEPADRVVGVRSGER